jgi:uncharacterized protein YgbK (DUF1537 family)
LSADGQKEATRVTLPAASSGFPAGSPLGGLTVVGGETFAGVCRALRATRLRVDGEFLHGVPASRMESGLWSGTFCASKSGAFGEPDWLLKHLSQRC